MPAAELTVLRCERCGESRVSGATESGCLNCLLLDALAKSGHATSTDSLAQASSAETAGFLPKSSGDRHYQHYEILTREDGSLWELGRGAMGVTYKAQDVNLRVPVALKVINARYSQQAEARQRFLREARSAASLRHPNIASVFHFGTITRATTAAGAQAAAAGVPEAEECFYAMEFIEGETLEAKLRARGPLDAVFTVEIALQITRALAAAEKRGLVHRDLKPANIMLVAEAGAAGASSHHRPALGEAWVKVIDFGLAKAVSVAAANADAPPGASQGLETRGGFLGTPQFASPEQFDNGPVDVRSDVFSLGIVLWYLLTGALPFDGRSLAEIHHRQLHLPLPVEQLNRKRVPGPLVSLVASMLAADPLDRPASAMALHNRLEQCLGALQTRGPRPLDVFGADGKVRRTATIGLVLLAAAALTTYQLRWRRPEPAVAALRAATLTPLIPEKSVAVLPFEAVGADQDNAFFTEGVQDEILTDLAKVADLKVTPRSSVLAYRSGAPRNLRAIGRELGVAHVVEGSVQRSGDRVRVSAQLVDVRSDRCLWAEQYERNVADVFFIQSEIAQTIAGQLQAKLSPVERAGINQPPTHDLAAYESYRRGRDRLEEAKANGNEEGMHEAVRQLEDATERDPQFFLAWCALADANMALYGRNLDRTPSRLARADAAVAAARRLRPDAGETHLAEGIRLFWVNDLPGAMRELRAAGQTLPNDPMVKYWLCDVLESYGLWEEARQQFVQAAALEPRNPVLWYRLGNIDSSLFHYRDAEHAYDRAIALAPQNSLYTLYKAQMFWNERADQEPIDAWLKSVSPDTEKWRDTWATTALYRALDARDYVAAARALARLSPADILFDGFVAPRGEMEGFIALRSGDKAAARTDLLIAQAEAAKMVQAHPANAKALMILARIESMLGLKDKAIAEGQRACALMPRSKDAYDWAFVSRSMAKVYAQLDEPDRVLEIFRSIAGTPAGISYGMARDEAEWDLVRGDPRFEAFTAALAPKS
jgi:TolB-like protein/Tfp pilus assembly protein PilF/tRNA A-37 threonylcarbamoyl transferase component Bud32